MITKLRVQNFKCLRDVTVELGPLTVLIGPNDSGKSSVLDALHLLGRTTTESLTSIFCGANDVHNILWKKNIPGSLGWDVEFDGGHLNYLLRLDSSSLALPADELVGARDEQGALSFSL